MVTYCMYALFGAIGTFNLVQGRPFVALFYAVLLGFCVWFDRKMAQDSKAHEERMAAADAAHKVLMTKLEAQTKRMKDEHARYLAENYFFQIVVQKADVLPLDERKEALIRQEFNVACDMFLQNIRG